MYLFKTIHIIIATIAFSFMGSMCNGQDKIISDEDYQEVYVDPYFEESYKVNEFTPEEIEKARKGTDFSGDYKTKEEKKEEEEKEQTFNSDGFGDFAAGFVKALFIIGLIAIIVMVLLSMISGGKLFKPKSKKITGSVTETDLEEIEDNLEDSDIESYLKKAIEDNDYRVAVRLYFLMTIRDLSKNKHIQWKRDKTNRDYIRETRALPFGEQFKETAHIFEKAWYGDFEVRFTDFQSMEQKFKALINKIKIKAI